jgi:hypothetical protein
MKLCIAIAILAVLSISTTGHATTTNLVATIDGAQANAGAGSGSPGTGSATLTYDDNTNLFSWSISWGGLLGTVTLAHFHGPAFPNQNAGIQVNIGAISGLVSPSIGATVITPAQAADLLSDLWYINIHTDLFPAGEIRGQVTVDNSVSAGSSSWSAVKALYE